MDITVSQMQGRVPVSVLRPHGELDASNYLELIAKGQEVYNAGARDILLDMSDIPYMSSSGVMALQSIAAIVRGEEPPDPEGGWGAYHAVHRDRDAGCQQHFKLLNPQPRVDRVLEMVGFNRFLEIYKDLETAVASF